MGIKQSKSSATCSDCAEEIHFKCEEDLDAHQLSIHWCIACTDLNLQNNPFLSYEDKQNHIISSCSSTAQLAGRTRGMSNYDSSTSSANIRKRFLPESFEGHHIIGLSSETIHGSLSQERLTFSEKAIASHFYYFDVAVPGSTIEDYTPNDLTGAAVTCCFEAAHQLLQGHLPQ